MQRWAMSEAGWAAPCRAGVVTVSSDQLAPAGAPKEASPKRATSLPVVRRRLALLALMTLLPLVLMGTLWAYDAAQRERARLEEVASKLARDVVVRLDAELAGHIRALEVLAALPVLDDEDLTGAQEVLGRALATEPLWQNLFVLGPDGRQLVNAAVPGALRSSPVPETVASIFRTGRGTVTDVATGPQTGRPAVALQVPVKRGDTVRYVLSGVLEPAPLADLFRQFLTPGWRAMIVDRNSRIVVRTSDGAALTGTLASEATRAALAQGEEGRLRRSASTEGTEYAASFLRSPLTGWSVHAGIPREELSPLQRTGFSFIFAGVLTSGVLAGLVGMMLFRDLRSEQRRQTALQSAQDQARNALKEANAALEARVQQRTDELQTIIRQIPAGVIMAEAPSGRIMLANDAASRILGREAPRSSSATAYPSDYGPHRPDKTPFALGEIPMVRAIRCGESVTDEEVLFPLPGGGWVTLNVNSAPIRDEKGTIRAGIVTFMDITSRKRLEEQQGVLLAELHHRVKNMLAVVFALVQQTDRGTPDRATFVETLLGRIQALARVQDFILSGPSLTVELRALLLAELAARGADPGERLELRGPDVSVSGHIAQSLELAIHELATNAIKHGALKHPGGRVEISWTLEGVELHLDWKESGVRITEQPERRGFGSRIIEQTIRALGDASLEFAPDGLRCRMRVPVA